MDNEDNGMQQYSSSFSHEFFDDPALIQIYFQGDAHPTQDNSFKNFPKIKLIHEGKDYQFSVTLVKFSQLLTFAFNDEDISVGQPQKDNTGPIFSMDIPSQVPLNNGILKLVEKFMQVSDWNPSTVKLGKIKPYSVKPGESCPVHIVEFIGNQIQLLQHQKMNQLILFCRYIQMHSLLEVIYYHLATKYSCPYTEDEAKQLMDKYKVKKFNNHEATQMKIKYLDYFKKLSRDFIQIEEERRLKIQKKLLKDKN